MDSDGWLKLTSIAAAVWPLLMATHYLVAAANIYTKPGMSAKFVDDFRDEIKTASMDDPLSEVFLKKSARYLHNFLSTLESQWPVLAILSQLTATAVLSDVHHRYLKPFWTGKADVTDLDRYSIVECGAHDGHDSEEIASTVPSADIWAFEAQPRVYEALLDRMRKCGAPCANVHPVRLALGSTNQARVEFFSNVPQEDVWMMSSSSLYRPQRMSGGSRYATYSEDTQHVQMRRLEDVVGDQGIVRPIVYMDLDAEGGELDILKGAGELLSDVQSFKVEIRNSTKAYAGIPLWPEVRSWLEAHGFVAIYVASGSTGDAFFVRRHLALL